jgi:hypothetical protein
MTRVPPPAYLRNRRANALPSPPLRYLISDYGMLTICQLGPPGSVRKAAVEILNTTKRVDRPETV